MTTQLEAALTYAANGQPVFPCWESGPKAKAPRTKRGLYDATKDENQITEWWENYPDAAIGMPTGKTYDVIDVDVKKVDGQANYEKLQGRLGLMPTHTVKTPSGGTHYYFSTFYPTQAMRNYSFGRLGIDIRGLGGYVIAPPSQVRGKPYTVEVVHHTSERLKQSNLIAALKEMQIEQDDASNPTDAARTRASGRSYGANNPDGILYRLLEAKEGERNSTLFWAACRYCEDDLNVLPLLWAAEHIGLGAEEALRTVKSAQRRVQQEKVDDDNRNTV